MSTNTLIALPEISPSQQDEWDLLREPQELKQEHTPPTPTTTETEHHTGLTRAPSLTRQLSHSAEKEQVRKEVINILTSNPSHLFWVPASQHPEIAPTEFEKYVEAHGLMIRRKSTRRRQSILSEYFTANDQQKLMEEEARKNKTLRRSVSLQFPPAGEYRNVPDFLIFDRNSSPLDQSRALVPKGDRPLLRRGARTNFKRNSSVTPVNQQRPPLVKRKSESDYHVTEGGITLSDNLVIEEPVQQVRDLSIATREPIPEEEDTSPPTPFVITRSVSTSTPHRKSAWSWAFWSDEKSKKNKVDPVTTHEQEDTKIPAEPSTTNRRFTLSSLFSRKPKHNYTPNIDQATANLAQKDDKQDLQLNPMYMTRLPLHVERAIYKLSHIKLANPRRPLHEQVLISNQMFWYLSVIANNNNNNNNTNPYPSEERKRKKRLVKRPLSAPQPKKGAKHTTFMSPTNGLKTEPTGFVVPDNYLNPQKNARPIKAPTQATKSLYTKLDQRPNRQQISDSSSSEDEEEEEDESDEENRKDDDVPLALYKQNK
ncbi:hypothetical protein CU098_005616 [Rhizopus stolonifer]|uniref:Protein Zds1 C-terminal domain-containing protein n=1 Tax=Rhizopus stolonifer TaxID=4846 RepID=A0A367J4I5_RHIST|nr:hypothetical protein CU098_005616 [Rhizopus stolonifer]